MSVIYDTIRAAARSVKQSEHLQSLADRMRGVARVLTAPSLPLHRNEEIRPFFIVGSGRCGTTLLRRLLQASPKIHIPPENWTFGACTADFRTYRSRLSWNSLVDCLLCRHILENDRWFDTPPTSLRPRLHSVDRERRSLARFYDEVYRYHGEMRGAEFERWGDKTPANVWGMDQLLHIFPGAKFVHIIRDGVDVAHSYERRDQKGLVKPAQRWKSAVTAAQEFSARHPDRMVEVRYEDLCRKPQEIVRKTYQFIDVLYRDDLLSRTDHYDELKKAQSISHYENVFESISTVSIGKGRRNLTTAQKEKIAPVIGDELVRQGYAPVRA
jgi:hypothetical protein